MSTDIARITDDAAVKEVSGRVSEFRRKAVDTIDGKRSAAASGLDRAASTLHRRAERLPGGPRVSRAAHSAADSISAAGAYVRDHDVNRMLKDVETVITNNPGRSLLAAAAIGFVLARAFRRDEA